MAEYLLPDVGEGLTEAEIVSWKVKVGDVVDVNEVIVEIETAKSLVELPSPYAGTVLALLVAEGDTVPVGTPIIAIGEPGAATTEAPVPEPAAAAVEPAELEIDLSNPAATGGGAGESLVGRAPAERGATRRLRRKVGEERAGEITAHADVMDSFNPGGTRQHEHAQALIENLLADAEADAASSPADTAPLPPPARALAKPPVRKLAKDLGVDLATIAGTGPDGVVTRADVEAASGAAAAGARATSYVASTRVHDPHDVPREREVREPVKGVRKMMAQAMVSSAFTAPHVTEWVTLDATRTVELVAKLKKHPDFAGTKVTPLVILAWAVLRAMRATPEINSFFSEGADGGQEVVVKSYVNLGIAAATPRGLVVPNVKEAQSLSLPELAAALDALTATAREGRTQPAEMAGGTFTITNVGVFGIDSGTPIINPGESAILAFGAIRKQPWVVSGPGGDQIAIRQVTTLALSFDHRHIDGEKGSRFLADVASILEDPALALVF